MIKRTLYQNKQLTYSIQGEGLPVVLLHGFGEDARIWDHQKTFLEKNFKVLIPDLPGSGGSEMADDMSTEGMADCINHILQQENIATCTMIGHSMGGYITLAFAEKYQATLASFGLFHSTAFADSEEKKLNREKGIQTIKQKGAQHFLEAMIPNLYGSYTHTTNSSIIREHIKQVDYFTAEALTAYYEAMIARPDRTAVLKQNKIPVLFVLGKQDNTILLEDGLKLVHMPDLSYIHILELSGHMGMKEEWEQSNRLLYNFLLKTI